MYSNIKKKWQARVPRDVKRTIIKVNGTLAEYDTMVSNKFPVKKFAGSIILVVYIMALFFGSSMYVSKPFSVNVSSATFDYGVTTPPSIGYELNYPDINLRDEFTDIELLNMMSADGSDFRSNDIGATTNDMQKSVYEDPNTSRIWKSDALTNIAGHKNLDPGSVSAGSIEVTYYNNGSIWGYTTGTTGSIYWTLPANVNKVLLSVKMLTSAKAGWVIYDSSFTTKYHARYDDTWNYYLHSSGEYKWALPQTKGYAKNHTYSIFYDQISDQCMWIYDNYTTRALSACRDNSGGAIKYAALSFPVNGMKFQIYEVNIWVFDPHINDFVLSESALTSNLTSIYPEFQSANWNRDDDFAVVIDNPVNFGFLSGTSDVNKFCTMNQFHVSASSNLYRTDYCGYMDYGTNFIKYDLTGKANFANELAGVNGPVNEYEIGSYITTSFRLTNPSMAWDITLNNDPFKMTPLLVANGMFYNTMNPYDYTFPFYESYTNWTYMKPSTVTLYLHEINANYSTSVWNFPTQWEYQLGISLWGSLTYQPHDVEEWASMVDCTYSVELIGDQYVLTTDNNDLTITNQYDTEPESICSIDDVSVQNTIVVSDVSIIGNRRVFGVSILNTDNLYEIEITIPSGLTYDVSTYGLVLGNCTTDIDESHIQITTNGVGAIEIRNQDTISKVVHFELSQVLDPLSVFLAQVFMSLVIMTNPIVWILALALFYAFYRAFSWFIPKRKTT